MFAAVFSFDGFYASTLCVKGDSLDSVVQQLNDEQDLRCLCDMGRRMEPKKKQKEIDKLEAFVEKFDSCDLTLQDVKDFSISLSTGNLSCIDAIEGSEEEIAAFMEKYEKN